VFFAGSRYADCAIAEYGPPDGPIIRYARRRFLPDPSTLVTDRLLPVLPMDRVDRAAYRAYRNAELSWRLADGNGATDPRELTDEPGRLLRVTLVAGIPGGSGA
jgi:hypothetical protein